MLVNGVDIIEISRVGDVAARYGERFYRRIYTQGEIDYCRGRAPQLASRFAAKEAVMKALGTGTRGVRWRDIEVVREKGRAPTIRLHGSALARAQRLGIDHLAVSLSHSREYAVAFVVAESASGNLAPWGRPRRSPDRRPAE
jgi:holo-[acyl-carrier protein] synthase